MTCAEVDDRLEELNLDVLASEEKCQVEEHLAGCSACRASKEKVTVLERELRSARGPEISPMEVQRGLERARSRISRPGKWLLLVPMAAAVLFFGVILFWFVRPQAADSGWGTEIGYHFRVPEAFSGERSYLDSDIRSSVLRRLEESGRHDAKVRIDGDRVVLRFPGSEPEQLFAIKRILRTMGHLELCPAAPRDMQERFNLSKTVPEGYRVVENSDRSRGGEYEAYGALILIKQQSIIDGRQIITAEPRQEMTTDGARWVTAFTLDAEGARRFDEAAEWLYNMRPPGLIAILLDGKLKSVPAVQSNAFHGHGQISGAKDQQDAIDLAVILKSGRLPVPLGEPEFERPYGSKKK